MREYTTIDTSIDFDGNDRIKRQSYAFIDPRLLKKTPRKLIEFILGDQYTGDINKINQKALEKIIKSLADYKEFKKTIQILPVEIHNQFKDNFLDIVVELYNTSSIDIDDYKLLKSKFGIDIEDIKYRDEELKISRVEVDSKQKIIDILKEQENVIKPAEFIRKNSKVQLKNRENETDEEYNLLVEKFTEETKNYIKLSNKYKLDKERKKILKYLKTFILCNPDFLNNNCFVSGNGYYTVSKQLHNLIGVYMNIPQIIIEDFADEANIEKFNVELFLNYVFTTPGQILTENKLILGLKKVAYTLNPELFKYKHTTNEYNK